MRILLIEDDPFFRTALRTALQRAYPQSQIFEAQNGRDGLHQAIERKPDLILLDGHMPLMNGNEVALALRQSPETDAIPLIAISGEPECQPLSRELKQLCNAFLSKPMSLRILHQTIGAVCGVLATVAHEM